MKKWIKNNKGILLITAVYLASFVFMLPLRSQTFQDDWAYVLTVKNFVETGSLKISEWSATAFLFPAIWGAIFSIIFGYSIAILHLSTIVLFYPALICFYLILKRLQLSEFRAILFTLLLLSYPWVFLFSYSFLSDVPYISLIIISLYYCISGLQDKRLTQLMLAGVFAGLAALTRQLGVVTVLSTLTILAYQSLSTRKLEWKAMLAITIPFLVLFLPYTIWSENPVNMTIAQQHYNLATLKVQTFPYLLPLHIKRLTTTHAYYGEYIKRLFYYYFHLAPFLLPSIIFFKYKNINLTKLKEYKKIIIISYLAYFLLLFLDIRFHFGAGAYELNTPSLILRYDKFSKTIGVYWKYITYFSGFVFVTVLGIGIQQFFTSFLKKKEKLPKHRTFVIFASGLFILLIYLGLAFNSIIPYAPTQAGFTIYAKLFVQTLFSSTYKIAISQTWLIAFVLGILGVITVYSATKYSFKFIQKDKRTLGIGVVVLSLMIQFLIILLIMYFYYAQYMISCVPFILICLAYLTKNLKIQVRVAYAVIIFMLIFSVSLTKVRYSDLGIQWELGNKLIEMGAKPVDIGYGDESWMRYWYGEQTLSEEIKAKGGDKYKVGFLNTWTRVMPTPGVSYSINQVSLTYQPSEEEKQKIVIDTGTIQYNLFTKVRFIATHVNANN